MFLPHTVSFFLSIYTYRSAPNFVVIICYANARSLSMLRYFISRTVFHVFIIPLACFACLLIYFYTPFLPDSFCTVNLSIKQNEFKQRFLVFQSIFCRRWRIESKIIFRKDISCFTSYRYNLKHGVKFNTISESVKCLYSVYNTYIKGILNKSRASLHCKLLLTRIYHFQSPNHQLSAIKTFNFR